MRNLDEVVSRAAVLPRPVPDERVFGALNVIADVEGAEVSWEPGDEGWGQVHRGGVPLALIGAELPMVFHVGPAPEQLASEFLLVQVESMSAPVCSVSRDLLERVLQRQLSDAVDYQACSPLDLWWAMA